MLDIRLLRDDPEGIAKRLKDRNPEIDISEIIALDRRRLELIREVEDLKAERNRGSQEVGRLKKEGKDASALLERLGELAERIDAYERELKEIEPRINDLLARLPNLPHPSVPVGKKEEKVVVRSFGARPEFDFPVKHHL